MRLDETSDVNTSLVVKSITHQNALYILLHNNFLCVVEITSFFGLLLSDEIMKIWLYNCST